MKNAATPLVQLLGLSLPFLLSGSLVVEVEDNGYGIPAEKQALVFDKFYRGMATESSEHRGNGLGLAFAREIARLHGGAGFRKVPGCHGSPA